MVMEDAAIDELFRKDMRRYSSVQEQDSTF